MRRSRHLLLTLLLLAPLVLPSSPPAAVAAPAEIKSERWIQTSVEHWRAGASESLLISNNAGGEVRLEQGARRGILLGPTHQSSFSFTALTVAWSADIPPQTSVTLEVRTSVDGESWTDWQTVHGGRVNITAPLLIEDGAQWMQYRLDLRTNELPASPVISDLSFTFLDASEGPTLADQPVRQLVLGGDATLTPRPSVITPDAWGASPLRAAAPTKAARRLVVSVLPGEGDPLARLRLLQVAQAQGALPYAFFVASNGTLLQGRSWATDAEGVIGVAFLGQPTDESRQAMAGLLAWLAEAYGLSLDTIVVDQTAPAELQTQLRAAARRSTVLGHYYFPEGNTRDYTERLMLYNPGSQDARASLVHRPARGAAQQLNYTVPAGEHLDIVVNDVFSGTTDLPLEVISDRPLVTEQTMLFVNDALNTPGIAAPSRSWYFAEGQGGADVQTYLLLYNPQSQEVATRVMLMDSEGLTKTQQLAIQPHSRYVLRASDIMTDTFGARVISSLPIAAVRTMRLGDSGGHLSNGASAPSRTWYFAEGTSEAPITTTLALLNPNPQRANATLTIFTGDGTALSRSYAIPPNGRLTINLRELAPGLGVASAITADRPVVAERTMLFDRGRSGSNTLGAPQPAYVWRFAEGRTGGPASEFLVIANPNDRPARLRVVFDVAGEQVERSFALPRRTRTVLPVNDIVPGQRHTTTVFSSLPVVAERTILISNEQGTGAHTSLGVPEP